MPITQALLRSLRRSAFGLWFPADDYTLDAGLMDGPGARATRVKTAICHVAYANDCHYPDLERAFGWGTRRTDYLPKYVEARHVELMRDALYAGRYTALEMIATEIRIAA